MKMSLPCSIWAADMEDGGAQVNAGQGECDRRPDGNVAGEACRRKDVAGAYKEARKGSETGLKVTIR